MFAKKKLIQAVNADAIYRIVMKESRLHNLGVSLDRFKQYLPREGRYSVEVVARAFLAAYFIELKPEAKVWIVKDGANGYYVNQIAKEIPSAKYIHIVRDGRAVLNSKLNTDRPYVKGEKMARDPVTAARLWKRLVSNIDSFEKVFPGKCLVVRYEDLLQRESWIIGKIWNFLNVKDTFVVPHSTCFSERLPDLEKGIHALVGSSLIKSRIDGWKKELPVKYRYIFECIARDELLRNGYEVKQYIELGFVYRFGIIPSVYFYSCFLRWADWGRLLFSPDRLLRVLQNKILYRG